MNNHFTIGNSKIPYEQFILNENQQFCCIGCNFKDYGDFDKVIGQTPEIKAQYLGTLRDQNFIFQQQIINSLNIQNWDFSEYPNPEIVLLTNFQMKRNREKL